MGRNRKDGTKRGQGFVENNNDRKNNSASIIHTMVKRAMEMKPFYGANVFLVIQQYPGDSVFTTVYSSNTDRAKDHLNELHENWDSLHKRVFYPEDRSFLIEKMRDDLDNPPTSAGKKRGRKPKNPEPTYDSNEPQTPGGPYGWGPGPDMPTTPTDENNGNLLFGKHGNVKLQRAVMFRENESPSQLQIGCFIKNSVTVHDPLPDHIQHRENAREWRKSMYRKNIRASGIKPPLNLSDCQGQRIDHWEAQRKHLLSITDGTTAGIERPHKKHKRGVDTSMEPPEIQEPLALTTLDSLNNSYYDTQLEREAEIKAVQDSLALAQATLSQYIAPQSTPQPRFNDSNTMCVDLADRNISMVLPVKQNSQEHNTVLNMVDDMRNMVNAASSTSSHAPPRDGLTNVTPQSTVVNHREFVLMDNRSGSVQPLLFTCDTIVNSYNSGQTRAFLGNSLPFSGSSSFVTNAMPQLPHSFPPPPSFITPVRKLDDFTTWLQEKSRRDK